MQYIKSKDKARLMAPFLTLSYSITKNKIKKDNTVTYDTINSTPPLRKFI